MEKQPPITPAEVQFEDLPSGLTQRLALLGDFEQGTTNERGAAIKAAMQLITETYVYNDQGALDAEVVWDETLWHIACAADLALTEIDEAYHNAPERVWFKDKLLAESALHATIAACAMYTIDCALKPDEAESCFSSIDILVKGKRAADGYMLSSALGFCRSNNLRVKVNEGRSLAVIDQINERRQTIAKNLYDDAFFAIEDIADADTNDEAMERIYSTQEDFNYLRYTQPLPAVQWNRYLQKLADATATGNPTVIEALGAVPAWYMELLTTNDTDTNQTFMTIIDNYTASIEAREIAPSPTFLLAVDSYFPNGIYSDEAKRHPSLAKMSERLPDVLSTYKLILRGMDDDPPQNSRASNNYNVTIKQIVEHFLHASLDDKEFAASYAQDMNTSITQRKNANKMDTLDPEKITPLLEQFTQLQAKIGAENFQATHDVFNLAAIDHFNPQTLSTLVGIATNDERALRRLRKCDLSLVMFDAFGSDNEAIVSISKQLQSNSRLSEKIMVPWKNKSDFYRTLALLKKRHLKFCNLVFAAHGKPGAVGYGRGRERFYMTSNNQVFTARKPLEVDKSSIQRVVAEYMCRPQHAQHLSTPAIKRIIVAACSSDATNGKDVPSVAESLLTRVDDKKISVIGTANVAYVDDSDVNGRGLRMTGHQRGVHDPVEFDDPDPILPSNVVELRYVRDSAADEEAYTIDRRPIPKRIVT